MTDTKLLTTKEAAAAIGVSLRTFYYMIAEDAAPTAVLLKRGRRWRPKDIENWEDNLAKENQTLNPALR